MRLWKTTPPCLHLMGESLAGRQYTRKTCYSVDSMLQCGFDITGRVKTVVISDGQLRSVDSEFQWRIQFINLSSTTKTRCDHVTLKRNQRHSASITTPELLNVAYKAESLDSHHRFSLPSASVSLRPAIQRRYLGAVGDCLLPSSPSSPLRRRQNGHGGVDWNGSFRRSEWVGKASVVLSRVPWTAILILTHLIGAKYDWWKKKGEFV